MAYARSHKGQFSLHQLRFQDLVKRKDRDRIPLTPAERIARRARMEVSLERIRKRFGHAARD